MGTFKTRLTEIIASSGIDELTVIINGAYYITNSRLTYVKVDKDNEIIFYNKVKGSDTRVYDKVIDGCILQIRSTMREVNLFGQEIEMNLKNSAYDFADNAQIIINEGLQFLIIESFMYAMAKKAIIENISNASIETEDYAFHPISINRMKTIFEMNAYVRYKEFLDTKNSKKIIHRLLSRNKFYSIQRAFVPIFISIKGLYNPLLDNPKARALKNSDLYKLAIEKNRFLDINGYMSAYMVTHLEICKSLHISNFMRFTPLFLYELLAGLIFPESSHFPNNTQTVFMAPVGAQVPKGIKSYYTQSEFIDVTALHKQKYEKAQVENNKELLEEEVQIIQALTTYDKSTTMRLFCSKEFKNLISFAGLSIDERVTVDELNTYLLSVSLN